MSNQPSFLWHDYETFGATPASDRPSQFAAIRTDLDFNLIGEPETFYCQQTYDYVPKAMASIVTGITPQHANFEGMPEFEFAARVNQIMAEPATCVAGYNSIQFDDEVTRHTFFRNFIDPYAREWQNGNSRWDLINPVRMMWALRPEGMSWPSKDDGTPSFRLEELTAANGISHENAHDALSDVWATIAMAKLMKQHQPKLFDFLFNNRKKAEAFKLLNPNAPKPVVHSSGRIPGIYGSTSVFVPLLVDPENRNKVWCWDLRQDPTMLVDVDPDTIVDHLYSSKETLEEAGLERPALKGIHINKCPALAPISTLDEASQQRIHLPMSTIKSHWQIMEEHLAAFQDIVSYVASQGQAYPEPEHPEQTLYQGFIDNHDKDLAARILPNMNDLESIANLRFESERLNRLWHYFKGRHAPALLSDDDKLSYDQMVHKRLFGDGYNPGELALARQELNELKETFSEAPEKLALLQDLSDYYQDIEFYWSAQPL